MATNDIVLTYDPADFTTVRTGDVGLSAETAQAAAQAATQPAALAADGAATLAATSTAATLSATDSDPEMQG